METPTAAPPPPLAPEAKEIHHHHYHEPRGFSPFRLFVGFLVILIGLSLLARSFGLDWAFRIDLWKYWPVLVILIGLSLLTRGRASQLLGIVIGLFLIGLIVVSFFGGWISPRTLTTKDVSIANEGGAQSADIRVSTGAGKLTVAGGATKLLEGRFQSSFADLETTSRLSGSEQVVTVTTKGRGGWWFGGGRNQLDLKLKNDIPLKLRIDGGALEMDLDLRELAIRETTIDTGATDLTLTLGDKSDNSRVSIDAGASSIAITLPKTLGARLTLDAGASSKTLTDFVEVGKGTYESANYQSSEKKVELNVDIGAASLAVRWQ